MKQEDLVISKKEHKPEFVELWVQLTVSGSIWENAILQTRSKIAQKRKIPGFRKGKAPVFLSTQDISETSLLQDALEQIKGECERFVFSKVHETQEKIVAEPKVVVDSLTPQKALVTFRFPLFPTFELPDFSDIKLKILSPKMLRQDVVVNASNMFRTLFSPVFVEKEISEFHDTLTVDFSINIAGEEADLKNSGTIDVMIGGGILLPIIEEGIIGMRVGEEKEFNVIFPPFYPKLEFRNKPGSFLIKVLKIQRLTMPPLTVEHIRSIGYKHVNSLLDCDQLLERLAQNSRIEYLRFIFRRDFLNQLFPRFEVNFSQQHIFKNQQLLLERFLEGLRHNKISLQDYIRDTGATQDSIYEELKVETIKALKTQAFFEKLLETGGLAPLSEEQEKIKKLLMQFHGWDEEEVEKRFPQEQMRAIISEQKVMTFLMKSADPEGYAELEKNDYFSLSRSLDVPHTDLEVLHKEGKTVFGLLSDSQS